MSNISTFLHDFGLKATPMRKIVLNVLFSAAKPQSHSELESQIHGADRVTLYRVLDSLVSAGIALKAVDNQGVFRFSIGKINKKHQGHVHFRCTDCGGVYCLKAQLPPPPKLPRGFKLSATEYDIRGICAGCGKKQ